MRLECQSVKIIKQEPGMEGILKHAEVCGRICYKSEDRITQDSAERFVQMLKKSGHLSVLEHAAVYLRVPVIQCCHRDWGKSIDDSTNIALVDVFENDQFSRVKWEIENKQQVAYVTTNWRVVIESGLEEENVFKFMVKPAERHDKRVTVKMSTSIGISRELNRHRCHSISEQSTRYCNYSKDKFGSELTFIIPSWADVEGAVLKVEDASMSASIIYSLDATSLWMCQMKGAEEAYMSMVDGGLRPEQARYVLPLSTKTELVHTAYLDDWNQFFKQRCNVHAHPDMQVLAGMVKAEFVKECLIEP